MDGGGCRTAPATQGMLITTLFNEQEKYTE